ncbi:mechanosensitive ion channel domain-containing protein [Chloroflexota bacterium]
MWEWFMTNGVVTLVVSAVVLILLLFIRQRVQDSITKAAPKKWHNALENSLRLTVWVIGGILLVIIAIALAAVIISREGAAALVTPETMKRWFLEHGIFILVIFLISYAVYQLLKFVMPKIVEGSVRVRGKGRRAKEELAKRTQTLSAILSQIMLIIIIIVALLMILSEIGVNIAPLLAGAGIAGLAIGFGAQHVIKDILNGLFILLEDQYNKGDVVKIAGIIGLVQEVNLRRTIMRDLDGIVHSIPNGGITTASNYTKDWSRVNLDVSVAYGEDLDHVIEVINRVGSKLAEDDYFGTKIRTAPQVLRVNNFGDSGIDIKVLGETKPLMQWEVTGELRKRIKKAFDEEGIEIPWPHIKLYYGQTQLNTGPTCKTCSQVNSPGNKFCSSCGAKLGS